MYVYMVLIMIRKKNYVTAVDRFLNLLDSTIL